MSRIFVHDAQETLLCGRENWFSWSSCSGRPVGRTAGSTWESTAVNMFIHARKGAQAIWSLDLPHVSRGLLQVSVTDDPWATRSCFATCIFVKIFQWLCQKGKSEKPCCLFSCARHLHSQVKFKGRPKQSKINGLQDLRDSLKLPFISIFQTFQFSPGVRKCTKVSKNSSITNFKTTRMFTFPKWLFRIDQPQGTLTSSFYLNIYAERFRAENTFPHILFHWTVVFQTSSHILGCFFRNSDQLHHRQVERSLPYWPTQWVTFDSFSSKQSEAFAAKMLNTSSIYRRVRYNETRW